jgi:hypothetical protein
MPDLHRLPFYALAGTQNAITVRQLSTLPTLGFSCGYEVGNVK